MKTLARGNRSNATWNRMGTMLGLALGVVVFTEAGALARPSFRGLGDLAGGGFLSEGGGISADGNVCVGGSIVGGSGFNQIYAAFSFAEGSMSPVYQDLSASVHAWAVSADGSVIVGSADFGAFSPNGVQAFVWTPSTGAMLLNDLSGGVSVVPKSYARGVSGDGNIIVGIGESDRGIEAIRYDRATGVMEGLGDLAGGAFEARAYGISRDGSTIFGESQTANALAQAFRWTRGGGMIAMGFLPGAPAGGLYSEAFAASDNGAVIVGESRSLASGTNGNEAFRWTLAGGMQPLGDLPGAAFQSWAYAVSGDGSIVVGRGSIPGACGPFGCGSAGRAFVWDAANGMRDVQQILVNAGIDMTGWSLTEAKGVSRDGSTIVGTGMNPAGSIEAWIATIDVPARCVADVDDGSGAGVPDGGVTIEDLLYYLVLYGNGALAADVDDGSGTGTRDGGVTIEDLLYYLVRFEAGC
jgi:probable HAF family extracellular repeat protein